MVYDPGLLVPAGPTVRFNPHHDADGKFSSGGATGAAALAAPPLRLVENKKDPILGKVKSKPGPGMTDDEARSLSAYREAGFIRVNKSLRKNQGAIPTGTEGKHVTNIDSAMARSKLREPISVERGIGNGPATFGQHWNSNLTGTRFVDHGYVSTTADHGIAREFAHRPGVEPRIGAVSRVDVPAGTSAITLGGREHESEILLGRGHTFEITSDTGPGPDRQISMRIV